MNAAPEIIRLIETLQALGLGGIGLVFFAGVGFAYYRFKNGDTQRRVQTIKCPNTIVAKETLEVIERIYATIDRIDERQAKIHADTQATRTDIAILKDRSDRS